MRTVTEKFKVYKFEELDKEAKEKVKEWYLGGQESYIFDEMISEILKEDFPNSELKVQYSLSYSQGDGLNIYGTLDLNDLLNIFKDKFKKSQLADLRGYFSEVGSYEMPYNNRYAYSLSDRIDIKDEIISDLTSYSDVEEVEIDEESLEALTNYAKEYFGSKCKEFEKYGYEFFYEMSDEELEETCDANEYEFLEDGTIY